MHPGALTDLHEVPLDTHNPPTAPTIGYALDLDDAFAVADGGDEPQFEFSSATVREELARNFSEEISAEDGHPHSYIMHSSPSLSDPDASVSTIDIDHRGSPVSEHSSPHTSPPSGPHWSPSGAGDDPNLVSQFANVSLSTSAPELDAVPHRSPPVMIDVSMSQSNRVLVAPGLIDPPAPEVHTVSSEKSLPPNPNLNLPNVASSVVATRSVTPAPSKHRAARSVGPSALDKVVSKTRPSFLPPKSRQEDNKHLADWEAMMKKSRLAEEQRRIALQQRRLAREREVEFSLEIWEKQILPDWKGAMKNPRLRKLWWKGMPPKLRSALWERAVGNPLALSRDTYRTCIARAKRSLTSGSFPTTTLNLIDTDIRTTLPSLHIFLPGTGPLYQDLKDLLCAWVVSRSDEGLGYIMGASKIAGMFLLNMNTPSSAFTAMRNLMERHCMRSFYGGLSAKEDVEAYYRIFDTLLADALPKIYFNFKQHQLSPVAYLPDWILPLFLDHLPLEACARIWDVFILEGDSFLFRAALAVLAVLEPRLFFPDREELLTLLRGENKAALEVAKRDGKVLDGGKYHIYGVDEETLWERIDEMEWKDSTWARLIQRELPDL